jgi:hypothetical protein
MRLKTHQKGNRPQNQRTIKGKRQNELNKPWEESKQRSPKNNEKTASKEINKTTEDLETRKTDEKHQSSRQKSVEKQTKNPKT